MLVRKLFGVLLIAALPLSLTPTAMARTPAAVPKAKVKIVNFQFNPGTLTIAKGTKVVWVNTTPTTSHTSTSDTLVWDSGVIAPGAKFAHVFKTAGTFTYHCNIHISLKATVIVTG
jgi:plastocyanin